MMRLKVNGVEEEFAVTTISELLAFRGIDPVARFVVASDHPVSGALLHPPGPNFAASRFWPGAVERAGSRYVFKPAPGSRDFREKLRRGAAV